MDRNYGVIIFILKYLILRRPRVAIFAEIIKIVTIFIKVIFKDSKKSLKNYALKCNPYLYSLI